MMEDSRLILLVLAATGIFLIIRGILTPLAKFIGSTLEKIGSTNAYKKAYRRKNQSDVDAADVNLAYKKIKELETTTKSYRSRKTDLKSVMEMRLPATEKMRRLLTKALPNQNNPETIEIITKFLDQVNNDLKESRKNKSKLDTAEKKPKGKANLNSGVSAISLILTEILSTIYLFPEIETLTESQISFVGVSFVLINIISLFLIWQDVSKLPLYTFVSLAIIFFLIYAYSSSFHDGDVSTLTDVNFNGSIACPAWYKANVACLPPIVITSHSRQEVKMTIIYDEISFYLKDSKCDKFLNSEFAISQNAPHSFSLQAKKGNVFDSDITKITPAFIDTSGKLSPLNPLTCNINLEHRIWANSRQIVLDFLGLSGGMTAFQIIAFVTKKYFESK